MIDFKKISLKLQLSLFLFAFLTFLALQEKSLRILVAGCVAAASCVLLDAAVPFFRKKKSQFSESALVTGFILGFVLSSDMAYWKFALAAVFAILSKHVIRIKQKHIFNPAAFGAFSVILLTQGVSQWKGAYFWLIIIPFGIYFVFKIKRLVLAGAYFLTTVVVYGIQSQVQQTSLADVFLYTNYFLILIMLVEPKTSPLQNKQAIAFGAGASLLAFAFYFFNFPYDAELPALLGANLAYRMFDILKRRNTHE